MNFNDLLSDCYTALGKVDHAILDASYTDVFSVDGGVPFDRIDDLIREYRIPLRPMVYTYEGHRVEGKDLRDYLWRVLMVSHRMGRKMDYNAWFKAWPWDRGRRFCYDRFDVPKSDFIDVVPKVFFSDMAEVDMTLVEEAYDGLFSCDSCCDCPVEQALDMLARQRQFVGLLGKHAVSKVFMSDDPSANNTFSKFLNVDIRGDVVHFGAGSVDRLSRYSFLNATSVTCVDPNGSPGDVLQTAEQYLAENDVSGKYLVSDACVYEPKVGLHPDTNLINGQLLAVESQGLIFKHCFDHLKNLPQIYFQHSYKVRSKVRYHNREVILEVSPSGEDIGVITMRLARLIYRANRARIKIELGGVVRHRARMRPWAQFPYCVYFDRLCVPVYPPGVYDISYANPLHRKVFSMTLGELVTSYPNFPAVTYVPGASIGLRLYVGVARYMLDIGHSEHDTLDTVMLFMR